MAKNRPGFKPSDEQTANQPDASQASQSEAPATTEQPTAAAESAPAAPTPTPAPSGMPAVAGHKKDKRSVMLKDPKTGQMVKRHDWIREQILAGKSRSEVTQMIKDITGDQNFRYQIVFQATKDIQNIVPSQRKKAAAPAVAAQPAATPADGSAQPADTVPVASNETPVQEASPQA